ncbi:hypothetical protein FACS189429_8680 [Bacteroidia bacterium]|nr:hypothetical protein FACS189429_8680 [Bacteroidia bacterium]
MVKMKGLILAVSILLVFACKHKPANEGERVTASQLTDSAVRVAMYLDSQAVESALILLDKAIALDTNYFAAYWNKMTYQNQLELFDEAFETAKKIEHLQPNNATIKTSIGFYLDRQGKCTDAKLKYEEAEKIYETILHSETDEFKRKQIEFGRAMNLKLSGKEKAANEIFSVILQTETDDLLQQQIQHYLNMNREDMLNEVFVTQ